MCVSFCVNRVLEALEQTASAIENETQIARSNVVVEVLVMMRADLQRTGLNIIGLGGGNRVMLPPALFSLPNVPNTTRLNVISINNRNLIRPRARNNRLRSNIISVNLNVPGGLRNLGTDQRIRLTFSRVSFLEYENMFTLV